MDNQKQELIAKLKDSNNILVTVSANPSVDQLAACIGLTLYLNKLKKHATAVFSGEVPSTLQFLKPEETLEKNTDSLRDFIVSLDKSKADKLRYKVEDNIVKIFITPYKTSITQDDLDFSQGDFNVDVVLCLGVDKQADLDQAITSHGQILHDATIASVSIGQAGELGNLNWVEPQASSLSELAAQITDSLDREQMDGQIATSFLTGIVAETERFSNDKTSPTTMKLSADLMAAGANQKLVASELQSAASFAGSSTPNATDTSRNDANTTLEIGHTPEVESPVSLEVPEAAVGPAQATDTALPEPVNDEDAAVAPLLEGDGQTPGPASRLILQPPSMGGTLTANSKPEGFDPSVDPLTLLNQDAPMLHHGAADTQDASTETSQPEQPSMALPTVQAPAEPPVFEPAPTLPVTDTLPDFEPLPSEPVTPDSVEMPTPVESSEKSLADLELAVDSPHVDALAEQAIPPAGLDAARDAVMDAITGSTDNSLPTPAAASGAEGYLNVQDLPDSAEPILSGPTEATPVNDVAPLSASPADTPLTMPTPPSLTIPPVNPMPPTSVTDDAATAPPVPPPLPLDDLSKFTTPNQ
jgi:hypothetical protein